MGKLKGNARKVIQETIGAVFAEQLEEDIYRLRDGILIETEEGDVVIKVVLKKEEIEFSLDDVLDTYEAPNGAKAVDIEELADKIDVVEDPVDVEEDEPVAPTVEPLEEDDPLDDKEQEVELEQ